MADSSTVEPCGSWGISGRTLSDPAGVLTDCNETRETMLLQEQDENGGVCGNFMYDEHVTISFTVTVGRTTDAPQPGTQIDMDGTKYYVTNAQILESNQAYRKIQVSAERYLGCEEVTDNTKSE